jgi:hypothetical protein
MGRFGLKGAQLAGQWQDRFMKLDEETRKRAKEEAPLVAQALSGARDQYSYDLARQALQGRGVDVSKLPAMYDPQQVGSIVQMMTELPKLEPKVVGNQLVQPTRDGGVNVLHTAPDKTLVPVPDETSPTGFRNVPRDQAVNQPAMGPSGMSVEFGPDGKPSRILSGPGMSKQPGMGAGELKDLRDKVTNLDRIGRSLDAYEKALKTHGPTMTPGGVKGPKGAALATAHTDLLLELKEAYNLGVLNGPDYMLMLKVIQDPTSAQAQASYQLNGMKAFEEELKLVREKVKSARDDYAKRLGSAPGEKPTSDGEWREIDGVKIRRKQ